MELFVFFGKLRKDNTLITEEGTLHHVLHEDTVPCGVYGFFLIELRHKKYYVLKFISS